MSKWPKLCERWDDAHKCDTAICQRCEHEVTWDPEDGDPYDQSIRHHGCGGQIVMKWDLGDKCKGCGKLAYTHPVDGCCSRKCKLQREYLEQIRSGL